MRRSSGYQGGAHPGHAGCRIRDRLGRLLLHTPLPAAVAREIVVWTREQGLDPHLNHLERFILRADDPHADDYSAFMGARAELVADLVAVDPPPGDEGPGRRRAAAPDRGRAARARAVPRASPT